MKLSFSVFVIFTARIALRSNEIPFLDGIEGLPVTYVCFSTTDKRDWAAVRGNHIDEDHVLVWGTNGHDFASDLDSLLQVCVLLDFTLLIILQKLVYCHELLELIVWLAYSLRIVVHWSTFRHLVFFINF